MPIVQTILYHVPNTFLGFLVIASAIALSITSLYVIRWFTPTHKLKLHNDVAGFIFATLGVIYAVTLAFMVVVSWQNYNFAQNNVAREADCYADLYLDAVAFPPAFRDNVRQEVVRVMQSIIKDEWPQMRTGHYSSVTFKKMMHLWDVYSNFHPANETQKVFFAESVRHLNEAGSARRERLLQSSMGVHPILWMILLTGGMITIIFMCFFGTENLKAQMLMTSMLSTIIALTLFTVMTLDYPFTGELSIRPTAFTAILQRISETKF